MEVPRLGVKSEPQLLAYATATATRIWDTAVTYTTAYGNARSLTHWEMLGIELATLWFLVGFVSIVPQWELPESIF